ncbi:telomeric repeat-binding factor 2-interacting protein 1 [Aspergillus lentulus]|uniref:DNA-binding protein RAP1 n=1 Tax=Aspergillus lentulus TaxID=293939 RepID=A0AAN4PB63_ASPLE|nr:telomeric repeat-binding factor 2-interacting protein 1 [Aspergillus lentulus]
MTGGNVEGDDGGGNSNGSLLFDGKQFWLSHNIPQRSRFKELIETNGGIVRLQEKDADIKLVDHTRKNLPSDTYSFKFVEDSVRRGELADLEAYRAGPSAPRPVGATHISTRAHKIAYSLQDDQLLWDWVQPYEKDPRAPISGNLIYKQLAEKHPRHTWQSYRDRYLKRLRGKSRPGGEPASTGQAPAQEVSTMRRSQVPSAAPTKSPERRSENAPVATERAEARKRKRSPEVGESDRTEGQRTDDRPKKRPTPATLPEKGVSTARQRILEQHPTRTEPVVNTASKRIDQQRKEEPKPRNTEVATVVQSHKTQQPSENPDSVPDNFLFELPFFPSSPESQEEPSPEQDIDTWIEDRLRTGKADNEEQVIEALQCTSMDPRLADKVLEYLATGKGIPEDMAGVWTPEDDECVEVGNSRAIERVLKKHGSEAFEARWNYLSMARAAGLSGGGMGD